MMSCKKLYFLFPAAVLLYVLAGCSTSRLAVKEAGNIPKREFRGAWIQTVYQTEYKAMSPAGMKSDFVRKLNFLKASGINAVVFQVRPEADAFYKSRYEPWSRFYTGVQGLAPEGGFDLMRFLIEECHKRNMEFHAWLNPYRAGAAGSTEFAASHIMNKYPGRFVRYDNLIYFDPGQPRNREFICRVLEDIISRYDVDGIHLDDYFYPYPLPGIAFPDDKSFDHYGRNVGYTDATRNDWRRENVNLLVKEMSETIRRVKPWVRFGISPFGIYRNAKSAPGGLGSQTSGLQSYDDLFTDVLLWARKGWIDYMVPQVYWEIGHPAADYATLVNWWNKHAEERHLYIGQDVARTMKAGQLFPKMQYERTLSNVSGNCFWPANELLWNNGGISDSLRQNYHRYPALLPPYAHLNKHLPQEVKDLQADATSEGIRLHWNAYSNPNDPESAHYYVVYGFPKSGKIDISNPANILTTTREKSCLVPYGKLKDVQRFVVTAVNRFHNESKNGVRIKVIL